MHPPEARREPSVRLENPPTAARPVGQYSQLSFVAAGTELVHVAGQLPLTADGTLVADDFDRQAEHVLVSLAALLDAAGTSLRELACLRTYLTRPEDYARFKAVRVRIFGDYGVEPPPPATTIVVAWLVGGSRIEVDAVAAVPASAGASAAGSLRPAPAR